MNFQKHFSKKNFIIVFSAFVINCISVIYVSNKAVQKQTALYVYDNITSIPHNKVGLVLGTAPMLKNGNPNPYFMFRVMATAELYHAQKIDFVLISGDNSRKEYNEPEAFQWALIEKGIPQEKIYLDYAGFRTLDSVIRAKEIFGQESITIISQKFHNERAIYIAQKNGISAVGYNAQDLPTHLGLKTQIREYLARTKLFLDLFFGVNPKFLGEKIEIQ